MRKTTFLLLVFILTGTWVQAQFSHLKDIELKTSEDFEEFAEQVMDCSDYLLLTPYDKKDNQRQIATDFVSHWITGSPEFSLSISDQIKTLTEEKDELIGLYLTCYAKRALEDETGNANKAQLEEDAISAFLDYCANPTNKVKPTKEMKKVIALKNDGKIVSVSNYVLSMKELN